MSEKPRICLVGGGNITNLRHVPALKKVGRAEIVGVIGNDPAAVARTAERAGGGRTAVVDASRPFAEQAEAIDWFRTCDAVVIGTPPRTHHGIAAGCLELGKHVLTEKPMAMDPGEAAQLAQIAADSGKHLAVMHNFQFANGMLRLERLLTGGDLGELVSIALTQFTTRFRRLPVWYRDLPLGLFYDEAAHYFYITRRLAGPIEVLSGFGHLGPDPSDNTPILMSADMVAGSTPVHLFVNFNATVSEWLFTVSGSKKLAVYDFFRDILVVVPNDRQHLAADILRTSASTSFQHWAGFMTNGARMLSGNLLYGVDVVMQRFLDAVEGGTLDPAISVTSGIETVTAMNAVVDAVGRNHRRAPGLIEG